MKLAIINESSKFSGIGRYAADLAEATNATMYSLILSNSTDPSIYQGKVLTSKPFLKLGTGWYLNHKFPTIFLARVKKQIEKEVSLETILHYTSQAIPALNLDNRYIYTVHDIFGLNQNYVMNSRVRDFMRQNLKKVSRAERIIVVSQFVKSQLEVYGFLGKISVVYPPISRNFKINKNKNSLRKSLGLPEQKKLILSVSTQDPRKNLKAVAETMELLGEKYNLVRVGKPIGECYSFNNIDDEKLNMIYNACDVLLFPSLDEGFGYPLAEAMTVGLPVVASDIPVFNEIAKNAAVLVEPVPEKLARGVKDAINNSDTFRERGIQEAKRYSFDRFKEEINSLYYQLKE